VSEIDGPLYLRAVMRLRRRALGRDVLYSPAVTAAGIATVVHGHVLVGRFDEINDVTQQRPGIVMHKGLPFDDGTSGCLLDDLGL